MWSKQLSATLFSVYFILFPGKQSLKFIKKSLVCSTQCILFACKVSFDLFFKKAHAGKCCLSKAWERKQTIADIYLQVPQRIQ
jgi:hypothetical protein